MAATELARNDQTGGGYTSMQPLDVYSGGLSDAPPSVDWIATISCGRLIPNPKKPDEMIPRAARKSDPQWIYIHDENNMAPGLTQALQESNGRGLVIAFPWDDPKLFVQQSFRTYSHGSLKAYGDEKSMTLIQVTGQGRDERVEHITYMAGSAEYDELVRDSKANFSVFFALARWGENGPQVTFPDGVGMYRLRFTSRHTIRNILATIDETARMTNNRIAGIPFHLFVDFRQVAGPNGRKRDIPVFSIRLRPPYVLTSDTWRATASAAIKAGSMLQLPSPPKGETWETAVLDGPVGDDVITDDDVARLDRGGRCDKPYYTRLWHSLVRGTSLQPAEARHAFIADHTGDIGSLALFLADASESEAAALIAAAQDHLFALGEIEPDDGDDDDRELLQKMQQLPPAEPAILQRPAATGDDYERTYGAAYADQEPSKPKDAVIDAEAREVSESAKEPPPAPTEPTRRQELESAYATLHAESLRLDLAMPQLNPDWSDEDLEGTGAHWKDEIKQARAKQRADGLASGV